MARPPRPGPIDAGRPPARDAGPAGVTLVELLVALALSALVLVGVVTLWAHAQSAYLVGLEVTELQDGLRSAVDLLARELAAAGRDASLCAFDYRDRAGAADCDGAKVGACQARLGAGYDAPNGLPDGGPGCTGLPALPYREVAADSIRVRSDRNGNGRIAGMGNAVTSGAGADRAEEDVRYALSPGPGCPPGIARCLVRDDGGGPVALLAVEIARFELTYYPRPGFGPCAGAGSPPAVPAPCPAFTLPLGSQADADAVARIGILLTGRQTLGSQAFERTVATDVLIESRR